MVTKTLFPIDQAAEKTNPPTTPPYSPHGYIGKPSNCHRDVGGLPVKRFARNVGEEGETMYITENQ